MNPLPDTFYRISLKAIILNDDKMLVFKTSDGLWEVPGGGWNHTETLVEGLRRELREEVQADIETDGSVLFVYKNHHPKGYYKVSIAVRATLRTDTLVPSDDDIVETRFVTREELLSLPFQEEEVSICNHVNDIWVANRE